MNFNQFLNQYIITEEIHPEIMGVANSSIHKHYKFNEITKRVRRLVASGVDTGLKDDKPKKGSSRAVLFPKEDHEAKIDSVPTKIPHVMKIAFSGQLDKHLPHDHELLGQMQNNHEIGVSHHYSVLRPIGHGEYETNHEGFLPPLLDHHEDGDWMHVGKVSPIGTGEFKSATKTPEFPKGISHQEFHDAVVHHYLQSNGYDKVSRLPTTHLEKLGDHPLVQRALNFSLETDTDPRDFGKRNMGMWTHPVTGEKHIVAADAGFSREVGKAYQRAKTNWFYKNRGY